MVHWTLCMVLLLAGLPGAEPQPTYQNFQRQHVDHPHQFYCNILIAQCNMTAQGQPCRTLTPVHALAMKM
ncbi:PREDICTED: ribonuclease CL2-like, partial [Merops nubicus]|uniref:ribonuclease CL2-like n=1 Tax=Merops nubicus TaxID=57421 RepID=UPI0004F03FC3